MTNDGDCYKISHRNILLVLYRWRNMEARDSDKALIWSIGSRGSDVVERLKSEPDDTL